MNIDKLDRIVINSQEEIDRLIAWRDNNKDLVRNFSPVMENGVIFIKETPELRYIFRKQGAEYHHTVFHEVENAIVHSVIWDSATREGRVVHSVIEDPTMKHEYNMIVISLHATLMAYMEHSQENTESVSVKTHTVVVGHKKQKKSKKRVPVKIRRKVYTVSISKESLEAATRSYERHIEQWTVRGHWRKTKNGQVWIKPHVRGEGKEVTPKEYQL